MRAKNIGLSNMPLSDQQLIINNTEIYNYYRFRLNNMALSRFTYENLPDTIDRWFLEKTLLNVTSDFNRVSQFAFACLLSNSNHDFPKLIYTFTQTSQVFPT